MPEQKLITLPENPGRLQLVTTKINECNIMVQYRINFSQLLYVPGFYPYLKKFFQEIIEIQDQSVIVIKEIT